MLIAPKEPKAQMLILYELLQRMLGAVEGLGITKFHTSYPASSHYTWQLSFKAIGLQLR